VRPLATVVGAALIAFAIVFVFRWEIVSAPSSSELLGSSLFAFRLDRWSGEISACYPRPTPARGGSVQLVCEQMSARPG
jgi:hypothetical protein